MATEHIPSSSTILRGCYRAGAGGWNWCRGRVGRAVHERPLAVQLVSGLSLLLVVAAAACCLAIIPLGTPESKAGGGEGRWFRLNMDVDLQSLFGLHVTCCAQLYALAETPQLSPSPRIWTPITRALLVSKD
jgi:hypothetical protein